MVRPVKLAHIVFRTNQMDVMTRWWSTVLDADVAFTSDYLVFLAYDDEHHRVALINGGDPVEPAVEPRVGFYHAAFTYATLLELLDTGTRLQAAGIVPWRTINHGFTISFYYRDPDGNDLELQVDRFENSDDANAYMTTEAFRNNSIGCLIDPEDLRRQIVAGVPLEQVMRRIDE